MTVSRRARWTTGAIAATVFGPPVLALLFVALFGWNWMRGPLERAAAERSGRVLAINGDLSLSFNWPHPTVQANEVTFSNPAWARERQMVSVASVQADLDLMELLRRKVAFPEVRLQRPVVFLELGADGRKNWLLDPLQKDEEARIRIGRLRLDQGTLGYDDAGTETSIRAALSTGPVGEPAPRAGPVTAPGTTPPPTVPAAGQDGVRFSAHGRYRGVPVLAVGHGGPVLALRDDTTPYPVTVELVAGRTRAKAAGTITNLLERAGIDMRLELRGDSLAQLFPLLGIALPETRAYSTSGHLVRRMAQWRYEQFSGTVGDSDLSGTLQVVTGGTRPALTGELVSLVLDLEDLGPLIGSKPGSVRAAKQGPPAEARVLPDAAFSTGNWNTVDAEVTLKARAIRHAAALPIEALSTHLSLRDSVLVLDPLEFGVAGGTLAAKLTLDGRVDPMQARASLSARKVLLSRLMPTVEPGKGGIGQINGEAELAGTGNSVAAMLGTSSGRLALVVAGGQVSKLAMEKLGLHLWEVLEIKFTRDSLVRINCAVADFGVANGRMQADTLVFDTAITTITGSGSIDLKHERLDLTLNQKTKSTSPLAFRAPVHVHGSLAQPAFEVDKGRIAARGLGVLALGLLNPLLALIPLIDAGPGKDSDCARLVRGAWPAGASTSPPPPKQVPAPG